MPPKPLRRRLPYTISCQDCFELLRSISSHSIDAIVSDLPYGTTANAWDTCLPLPELWQQFKRIIKPRGAIVLTATQPFSSQLVMSNLKWFSHEWVWKKSKITGHLNAKRRPMRQHELILVFGTPSPPYYPQGLVSCDRIVRRSKNGSNFGKSGLSNRSLWTNYPKSILEYPSPSTPIHPTQKPIELMEYLVKTYTQEGQLVLDPTMGSGSTGVACINTGRKFIGCDNDQKWFDVAKQRLKEAHNA